MKERKDVTDWQPKQRHERRIKARSISIKCPGNIQEARCYFLIVQIMVH